MLAYGCAVCSFYFFMILFTKSEAHRGMTDSSTKIMSFLFFLFALLMWLNQPGNQFLEPYQYRPQNQLPQRSA